MLGYIVGGFLIIGLSALIVKFVIDIVKISKKKKAAKRQEQKIDDDLKNDNEEH